MGLHYSAITLLVCSIVGLTQASGWWMDQPYPDSSYFNEDVEYQANATLYCNDTNISPDGVQYTFQEWIRPDLVVMTDGDAEYFRTLHDTAGWRVENNNMEIIYAQERHFGFYYCRLVETGTTNSIYIKKGVNYNGPFFGDLWEKYEMNVIIGCSAAGGFLLACLIVYIVDHFCFNDDTPAYDENGYIPEPHSAANTQYPISPIGSENLAYSVEQPPTERYVQLDTPL